MEFCDLVVVVLISILVVVINWTTAIWQALGALMDAGRLLCRQLIVLYCIAIAWTVTHTYI